jgi:hypothetical protein
LDFVFNFRGGAAVDLILIRHKHALYRQKGERYNNDMTTSWWQSSNRISDGRVADTLVLTPANHSTDTMNHDWRLARQETDSRLSHLAASLCHAHAKVKKKTVYYSRGG